MLKIIGYRFYCKRKKFDRFLTLLGQSLSKQGIDYETIIYAHNSLHDCGHDETEIEAELFDFSAYIQGLDRCFSEQKSNTPKPLILFFNDTFIKQWPVALIVERLTKLLNDKINDIKLPLSIGRVAKSCNISSKILDTEITQTHFFLLNYDAAKYLKKLIDNSNNIDQYIPDHHVQALESLTINTPYFYSYSDLNSSSPKIICIKIELALGIYINNNGFMLDLFDSRLIKVFHRLKKIINNFI